MVQSLYRSFTVTSSGRGPGDRKPHETPTCLRWFAFRFTFKNQRAESLLLSELTFPLISLAFSTLYPSIHFAGLRFLQTLLFLVKKNDCTFTCDCIPRQPFCIKSCQCSEGCGEVRREVDERGRALFRSLYVSPF